MRPFLLPLATLLLLAPMSARAECGVLLDPALPLDRMAPQRFVGETSYRRDIVDGRPVIRADAVDGSASGLTIRAPFLLSDCPTVTWDWRADRVQPDADLRAKASEDFAAAIFFVFGEPGLFQRDVPALVYAWTNDGATPGRIIASPNMPDNVRTIVLQAGGAGVWARERRNLADDFRAAYGRDPPDRVVSIAIFTDNDQTRQPASALYGAIRNGQP